MPTRIKRYEDRIERYDALLARIEAEMGPEAVLEAREFRRGGLWGLFGGQRMVEVIATLEVDLSESGVGAAAPPSGLRGNQAQRAPSSKSGSPSGTPPAQPAASSPRITPPLTHADVTRVDLQADERISLDNVVPQAPAAGGDAARSPESAVSSRQPAVADSSSPEVPSPAASSPAPKPGRGSVSGNNAPIADSAKAGAAPMLGGDPPAVTAEITELKQTITELRGTLELLLAQPAATRAANVVVSETLVLDPHGAPSMGDFTSAPAQPARISSAVSHVPGLESSEALDTLMRAPALPLSIANPLALDQAIGLDAVQRRVYDRLLYWNVGTYDAIELINAALASWQEQGQPDEPTLLKLIFREICSNILLSGGIQLRRTPPGKAVALVGATGVGKTTTIAKLAAYCAFQQGRRVSLVSLDNYRIAAAEQLRTYTEIMGIDLDIVFSRDEFDAVMTRRRQGDLVLIDTAGRSPLNSKQIYELREMFSAHAPDEVHLVISATTKSDDLRGLLENFLPLSYDHIIVSKLDETQSLGCVYNVTRLTQKPISYFTIGQSVPEDIRPATLPFVQDWIEHGRIR